MWRRLTGVLFWSVIAAAFIGPGTVTAAASAGASYGAALVWALVFSTLACLLLQEASARLTIVSGRSLGHALRQRYGPGVAGLAVLLLVLGAIVLGCAAYEAGNILGGVAGAELALALPRSALTLGGGAIAFLLLWVGAPRTVARLLGLLVALMGVAFLSSAARMVEDPGVWLRGALLPTIPQGSGWIVLSLIGTTVVPYNLFLGSGLARGQRLGEVRFGLTVSILFGGLISAGIVVVGSAVHGPFDFARLAAVLGEQLGPWSRTLFAGGLFAAGLSSAVTAPLAAALTARGLFGEGRPDRGRWGDRSWRFRSVWIAVLAVGLCVGLSGIRPIPVIVLAQALNGLLLPFVAFFLLLAVNDDALMGRDAVNGRWSNVAMVAVVALTWILGLTQLWKAVARAIGAEPPSQARLLLGGGLLVAFGLPLAWRFLRRRDR